MSYLDAMKGKLLVMSAYTAATAQERSSALLAAVSSRFPAVDAAPLLQTFGETVRTNEFVEEVLTSGKPPTQSILEKRAKLMHK